jgi:hypothetical protein
MALCMTSGLIVRTCLFIVLKKIADRVFRSSLRGWCSRARSRCLYEYLRRAWSMDIQRPPRSSRAPAQPESFKELTFFPGSLLQDEWTDEKDFFDRLYPVYKQALFSAASKFASSTDCRSEKTLIFVSAGFDASVHEYPSMQRHGRNVPTAFYTRFAADAAALADELSRGTLVAVLEGGYSDSALGSGMAAFLTGLAASSPRDRETDWSPRDVTWLEKALAPGVVGGGMKQGATRWAPAYAHGWLERAQRVFARIHPTDKERPKRERRQVSRTVSSSSAVGGSASNNTSPATATRMTTRSGARSAASTPTGSTRKGKAAQQLQQQQRQTPTLPLPPPPPLLPVPVLSERITTAATSTKMSSYAGTSAVTPGASTSTGDEGTPTPQGLPKIRIVWKAGQASVSTIPTPPHPSSTTPPPPLQVDSGQAAAAGDQRRQPEHQVKEEVISGSEDELGRQLDKLGIRET